MKGHNSSFELVLVTFAWVEERLVGKLVFKASFTLLEVEGVCHELADHAHVGLPLLLVGLLMMLEEVIIRTEDGELSDVAGCVGLRTYQEHVRKHIQDIVRWVKVGAVILEGHWLNGCERHECTTAEGDQLSVVCGAALWVHQKRRCLSCLR